MKEKLFGFSVLVVFAWFFHLDVSAQKNERLLLGKKEAISSINVSGAVLDEINTARQKPQQFVTYLEAYRKRFSGLRVTQADGSVMTTFEGVPAVDEAIAFLRNLVPVEPLQMSEGLVKAADLQLQDLIVNPALGHTGANGSSFSERIKRFGTTRGSLGENIAMRKNSAREIVLLWIVDDGIASRLHRKNLFNSEYKKAGIACDKGNDGKGLCVLDLAEEFSEKGKLRSLEEF